MGKGRKEGEGEPVEDIEGSMPSEPANDEKDASIVVELYRVELSATDATADWGEGSSRKRRRIRGSYQLDSPLCFGFRLASPSRIHHPARTAY